MSQDDKEKVAVAMQLLSRGDYAQSEQIFKDLITSGSELAESFYGLGMIRLASSQPEIAMKQFENCIHLQPSHANAHYYLGEIAELRSDADAAKRFYKKALEINPKHVGALKKLGADPVDPPPANDLYALLRRSAQPVEQEIARHLDAITARIGTRRARFRAFIGLPLLLPAIVVWLLLAFIEFSVTPIDRSFDYVGFLVAFVPVFFVMFFVVWLWVRRSSIRCERDWLLRSRGLLGSSTQNWHLFLLSRGTVSVRQSLMNRLTDDGSLTLTRVGHFPVWLRGYFRKAELDDLAAHFRQISLLNPTNRDVLAALGELKNIRSGAN